jgi:hypothetical protein
MITETVSTATSEVETEDARVDQHEDCAHVPDERAGCPSAVPGEVQAADAGSPQAPVAARDDQQAHPPGNGQPGILAALVVTIGRKNPADTDRFIHVNGVPFGAIHDRGSQGWAWSFGPLPSCANSEQLQADHRLPSAEVDGFADLEAAIDCLRDWLQRAAPAVQLVLLDLPAREGNDSVPDPSPLTASTSAVAGSDAAVAAPADESDGGRESAASCTVRLDALVVDETIQPRAELNPELIEDYSEAMREGAKFPPIVAFFDGKRHWVADGFHRVKAAREAGREEIAVLVRHGSRRDAVLFAAGANAHHGLRRSNADKRRAVMLLLADSEWSAWSDREIARICGVSGPFVGTVRGELTANRLQSDVRRGADGRLMETSAIGVRPPRSGSPPATEAGVPHTAGLVLGSVPEGTSSVPTDGADSASALDHVASESSPSDPVRETERADCDRRDDPAFADVIAEPDRARDRADPQQPPEEKASGNEEAHPGDSLVRARERFLQAGRDFAAACRHLKTTGDDKQAREAAEVAMRTLRRTAVRFSKVEAALQGGK